VRSDKMEAARVEGGETAAASAAILRDASELARRSEEPARSPGWSARVVGRKVSLYVLSRPAGGVRDLVGLDVRL